MNALAPPPVDERAFLQDFRRALLNIVAIIDKYHGLAGGSKPPVEFKQQGKGGKPDS